jgi:lysophospholipase L1-like esterase
MENLELYVAIVAVLPTALIVFETVRISFLLIKSRRMTTSIRPYEHKDPNARWRVLLIGDSTGYGTGTSDSRYSLTGRLAAEYPNAHIENWSETGSNLGYVFKKLHSRPVSSPPFDLVIIMAGGMNVVHYTLLPKIRVHLLDVIQEARRHGKDVMIVAPHDAGSVPMFHPPLSWFNRLQARDVNRLFCEVCAAEHVRFVSLFDSNEILSKHNWFSADKTHPTDDGYAVWYEEMRPIIGEALLK